MSITRDFEKKDGKCCECGSFDSRDVLELLAHARALEEMLRKIEWSDGYYCPCCGYWKAEGHSPDCALAKLIGE